MKLIEIKDLSFTYAGSDKQSLANINLIVKEREFIVITGVSGCGKSTLLKCMNGLIPHFYTGNLRGEVYVLGKATKSQPTYIISQDVGMVFQNPDNQLFSLTVEGDVAFALENLGFPKDEIERRVKWAMEVLNIEDLKQLSPFDLSGGQKQKVALASVLALKPKVIMLDEPTSFLDPLSSLSLIETISSMREEAGITVIVVEHRLDLLIGYASRLIVMDEGHIVADGNPRDVLYSDIVASLGIGMPKVVKIVKELDLPNLSIHKPLTTRELSHVIDCLLKGDLYDSS